MDSLLGKRELCKYPIVVVAIFLLLGLIARVLFPQLVTEHPFAGVTVTLLSLSLFLSGYVSSRNPQRFIVWSLCLVGGTFVLEIFGVNLGIPFGTYSYGLALGLKWWGAPLTIGLAWYQLVLTLVWWTVAMSRKAQAVFVGGCLVGIDIVLEGVAPFLGMWRFLGEYPPVQNFVSWAAVSVLATVCLRTSEESPFITPLPLPLRYVLALQVSYFFGALLIKTFMEG
jgi:bisanhydrobacterioruberin hydratase